MPSPARTYEEAVALYRAGDLRAAEAACLEVLRGDAVHTRALFMLGALAHAAARYDDALEFFGRAAQSTPDDPTVRNALGAAHLSRGSLAEARECFEAALCLQPEHVEAQINLAT